MLLSRGRFHCVDWPLIFLGGRAITLAKPVLLGGSGFAPQGVIYRPFVTVPRPDRRAPASARVSRPTVGAGGRRVRGGMWAVAYCMEDHAAVTRDVIDRVRRAPGRDPTRVAGSTRTSGSAARGFDRSNPWPSRSASGIGRDRGCCPITASDIDDTGYARHLHAPACL